MKRKISFILLPVLFLVGLPANMAASFLGIPGVPDIVWDPKTMAQVEQNITALKNLYDLEEQTQRAIRNVEALVENPGKLQQLARIAGDSVQAIDKLDPSKRMDRLNKVAQLAKEAGDSMQYGMPTTTNVLLVAQNTMQRLEQQERADELRASMTSQVSYRQKVKQSGSFGCVSCTLGAHLQ